MHAKEKRLDNLKTNKKSKIIQSVFFNRSRN
jgi:hypothetical protein